jgi:polyhydroxyalkanoate synthesis repressor PhaR
MPTNSETLIKKYSNRRLYDTEKSCYLTQDELADKIRNGTDVRIVDAKTEEDITQETLAQMVFEGRSARLLPASLLLQLIRIGDDAVGDFFNHYVSWSLEMYLQSKRGVQTLAELNPAVGGFPSWQALSQIPTVAADALQRIWMANPLVQMAAGLTNNASMQKRSPTKNAMPLERVEPETSPAHSPATVPQQDHSARADIDELRRELAELKAAMVSQRQSPSTQNEAANDQTSATRNRTR